MIRLTAAAMWLLIGCGDGAQVQADAAAPVDAGGDAHMPGPDNENTSPDTAEVPCPPDLPYATEVVAFDPGASAGFGQIDMPHAVLGPPAIGPPTAGSTQVVSLGVGGEIVLSFGDRVVVDGDGPDLVVWENPFWVGGDSANVFAELGEVSVSEDGETWHTWPCDPAAADYDAGCAGWRPRLEFSPCSEVPLSPSTVGGDQFDLADLGLTRARYVRIRDLATQGAPPSAGFDLDAVGAVSLEPLE